MLKENQQKKVRGFTSYLLMFIFILLGIIIVFDIYMRIFPNSRMACDEFLFNRHNGLVKQVSYVLFLPIRTHTIENPISKSIRDNHIVITPEPWVLDTVVSPGTTPNTSTKFSGVISQGKILIELCDNEKITDAAKLEIIQNFLKIIQLTNDNSISNKYVLEISMHLYANAKHVENSEVSKPQTDFNNGLVTIFWPCGEEFIRIERNNGKTVKYEQVSSQ